jgi:hypothetical protein
MPKTDGKTHDLLGMTLTSITPVLRNQLKLKPSLSGAVEPKPSKVVRHLVVVSGVVM